MLERLATVLAQVKADSTSENVLNEICQIIYFLYQGKEITEKLYKNVMNLGQLQYKVDTIYIYMNFENSKLLILIDYYSIFQMK